MRRFLRPGFLLTLILTIVISLPLFKSGFFDVHDPTHIARVYLLSESLSNGQFPALWATLANQGYGYPLFHFYAPAFYYLVLLVKYLSPSYLFALKTTLIFLNFLGTFGIYRLLRKWGRGVAMLGAIAFALVPYRAITLYIRGSYAEFMATMLLPWTFLVLRDLRSRSRLLTAALVISLFLLSHNLIPLITFPFLAVYATWQQRERLVHLLPLALLLLGLTAFYTLPLVFENHFVKLTGTALSTSFQDHFVAPWQLWNSTWGFGGSAPGVEDGLSFKLGKLHLLLALIGATVLFLRRKLTGVLSFFLSLFILSVFLMTSSSQFFWALFTPLQLVQFPWRFLTLATFSLAVLASFSISLFPSKITKSLYLTCVFFLLIFFNLKYFQPQSLQDYTDQSFTNDSFLKTTVATKVPEYLPTWMPDFPTSPAPALPEKLVQQKDNSSYLLPRAYYPTWQLTVEGTAKELEPSQDGLLSFELAPGEYSYKLSQSHTNIERFAAFTSLATLLVVGYLYATRQS